MADPTWRRRGSAPRILVLAALLVSGAACAQQEQKTSAQTQGKASTPRQIAGESLHDSLSPAERAMAERLVQETLESVLSQQTRRWQYNGTGNGGFVTPLRTFRIKSGHYCREYMETVSTRQGLASSIFTACRDGEAKWQIVKR